uniref:(northern house mosquito) hypothetical protein n=1 Tax=Culex pipiens TaxID=7175 RepID=A0A8D8FN18_CULPI
MQRSLPQAVPPGNCQHERSRGKRAAHIRRRRIRPVLVLPGMPRSAAFGFPAASTGGSQRVLSSAGAVADDLPDVGRAISAAGPVDLPPLEAHRRSEPLTA